MSELISNYYDKYLKYKNKYLNLKYGGQPKYNPPHLRPFEKNYYIDIKKELFLDVSFKDKFVSDFNAAGYNNTPKELASIVYIYGNDKYPKIRLGETRKEFIIRKMEHLTQFPHVQMINVLYGEFKEIITNKVKLHEYFRENQTIQKYLIPWRTIKKETRSQDISKITFSKGESKVLKSENGYRSMGTIIVKNKEDILRHLEKYDQVPIIYSSDRNTWITTNNWIIENFVNQDKIEGRKFFIRVHILVISRRGKNEVYISNKHPYSIMKKESSDEFLSHNNIDNIVGSHLSKYEGRGGSGNAMRDINDTKYIIYNLNENPYWPKDLPDNYDDKDKIKINKDLIELFVNIFSDNKLKELIPDFKSPNGFEIFGCDISFESKEVKLHEINRRAGLILQPIFIEDIIKIVRHENNFNNFMRII